MKDKKTILIVDDEPVICTSMANVLKKDDRNIKTASGGIEAFRIINSEQIDLVMADLKMANGDGLDLLDNIRKKDANTPKVILITGYPVLSERQAQDRGALTLIAKPMDFDKIKKIVNKILT